jgi:hypothetical protein
MRSALVLANNYAATPTDASKQAFKSNDNSIENHC